MLIYLRRRRAAGAFAIMAALAFAMSGCATVLVSVDSAGVQGTGPSMFPAISADGRYAAFASEAANLVPGDTNERFDVFVRDLENGITKRVSVDAAGAEGDAGSIMPALSADGRYVAFESHASNLVPDDTNAVVDVFVHDRQTGATERISTSSAGAEGRAGSATASISADGRYVAFESHASNLVPADTNDAVDVFVRDRQTGATERLSVDATGAEGNAGSNLPAISADGRYVAFESAASNLVADDANGASDVFVRDRQGGTTERLSVDSAAAEGNGHSRRPGISADGRYVGFSSDATNLVPADTNGVSDIFVRDRQAGATEHVSVNSDADQGNGASFYAPALSADGRYVAFGSIASNFVARDANGAGDVFVRDRVALKTERVSISGIGSEGNADSYFPSISGDGRYVMFTSYASVLVAGDTNGNFDVFLHDRGEPAGAAGE